MQTGFVLIKYIRSLLQILLIIIVAITIFIMVLQTWSSGPFYEEMMLYLSIVLVIGLIALFLLRGPSKKSMKMKAEQREKALDYEGAAIIWEALEEFDEAAMVMKHIGQTGTDAMAGIEALSDVSTQYKSKVEYADDPLSQSLRGIAQVHLAGIGTRVFYAQHGGYDVHGSQIQTQTKLWGQVSRAVDDFFSDLRQHNADEEVIMLVFSEFGRRVRDNGNGTDHGSGGGALLIGKRVNGGLYGEYPSLSPTKQVSGDMAYNNDFRSTYSSILDDWLNVQPEPIVNGKFEKFEGILNPL